MPLNQSSSRYQTQSGLTERGLQRRIKRHLLKADCRFLAVGTLGLETVLMQEISALNGAHDAICVDGAVEFSGPFETIYHAHLHVRCAQRLMLRITSFTVRSYPELFNKCRRIPWEHYIGFSDQISVVVSARHSRLHHGANISETVFDAAALVMASYGRTISRTRQAPLRFIIRMFDDCCTVSIDCSGELLYKRGYRPANAQAPLRETVSAALLQMTGWQNYPVIADPLCGSGTIIIEAARMVAHLPVTDHRPFAFEVWPSFNPSLWARLKNAASLKPSDSIKTKLWGSDIDAKTMDCAHTNVHLAQIDNIVELHCVDFREFNRLSEFGSTGLIISNPPWGRRIGTLESVLILWRDLGHHLKRYCRGWDYALIASNPACIESSGLSPSRRWAFSVGGIRVALYCGHIK